MTYPKKIDGSTTLSGLPEFKRDPIIAPGIGGLFDFGPGYFRGGKTSLSSGDEMLSVIEGGSSASITAGGPLTAAGNGLVIDDGADQITTNEGFLFPSTVQHCAICVWVKVNSTGQDSGGSGIMGVTGSSDQYRIFSTADGSGNFTGMGARFNGTSLVATSLLAEADTVAQVVAEYKRESGGEYLNLYWNARFDRTNNKADVGLTAPAGGDKGILGDGVIAYPVASKCTIYRAWAVNMDTYDGSLQNLMYEDYQRNKGRFS